MADASRAAPPIIHIRCELAVEMAGVGLGKGVANGLEAEDLALELGLGETGWGVGCCFGMGVADCSAVGSASPRVKAMV